MHDTFTTVALALCAWLSLAATVVVIVRGIRRGMAQAGSAMDRWSVRICAITTALLFVYRGLFVHHNWMPLQAHVDGLLLIAALFGFALLFLQQRSRLPGLVPFALPVLTLILAWALCASNWTLQLFDLRSIWRTAHLLTLYLGTLFFAVAAIASLMYLYIQKKLMLKRAPTPMLDAASTSSLPSLERLERLIIRTSALGFALLTLGVVMGLVVVTEGNSASNWWYSPKIILSLVAWLVYALIANVRHASSFRGARAAWLSIVGLILVLLTFGFALAGERRTEPASAPPPPPAANAEAR